MRFTLLLISGLVFITSHAQQNRIDEEKYVTINGILQWVTIKGDSTKPAILFLHGGPGSPMSPYTDSIYGRWEKDFVLIQWDQRGTGKTYGKNKPEELTPAYLKQHPLTVDQMTNDGIEVTRYVLKRLRKSKLILFGTSWGSILGVEMAIAHPELFHSYIGHSQMVNPGAATISGYDKVVQLAQAAKDQKSLETLHKIGKPPYDTARHLGQLMRIIKMYQQKNTTAAPATWFVEAPAYNNATDQQDRSDGDDYSFVNYAGDKRLGVAAMGTGVNFLENRFTFKIPVYFIQGEQDIQTPASLTKKYFEKIIAPNKKFILLPKTEHGFNEAVLKTQMELAKGGL